MDDQPRKKMCLKKPSSQTRPKYFLICKFPSLNQRMTDLRTEHVSLWLLGSEKKVSLLHWRNPEEALEMERDHHRAVPGPQRGFRAGDRLPGCLLLSPGSVCAFRCRKRLSRQSWKWQAIFNTSFVFHSSGSYFYYHDLFIDFYPQISLPFTVIGSAKQPLKTKQTNAEPFPPSLQFSAALWLGGEKPGEWGGDA